MRAAWYDRRGPAAEVLQVGTVPTPEPGPGEVRVRVHLSAISPGDTKKRGGYFDAAMPYPRVIPHSDGAGVVDAVGDGVDPARLGRRVWVWGAQSYRPFGTAAEHTVVPQGLAVDLPEEVPDTLGACLGIPGITAHRAVFADGPVTGTTVLVHGALGGVATIAAQLARWGGAAQVISTVRRTADLDSAAARHDGPVVALDDDPQARITDLAPDGVDRVVEVSLSDNVDLDAAVLRPGGVIAAYATAQARTSLPFWPMLFDNLTIRLLGSDDFPTAARRHAVTDLTTAAAASALDIPVIEPLPLADIARAHDLVDAGSRSRALLAMH
ncbi:NADPH:quinone reductase [uncultured Pseudokineococcus sp.]|uniref:NADPH:quinone reductase n=1 Tax=uncultured Pseudokineococcus sp. TaxID=1642928 RepID=UPI002609D554|nr:NADPH:quinone reductase [uncultured Pseudokineococcus sp.]